MREKNISNIKFLLLFIFLLLIIIVLWARFISTKGLIVKEYPVYNKNINENYNGFKIVHFSDLLYGRTVNKKDVKKLVSKINEIKPDVVVFTGGLIDKDTIINQKLITYLTDELMNIDARIAKFAIIGDEDTKIKDYEIIMKNAGFTVLNNNYELIYYNSNIPIVIAGYPSLLKGTLDNDSTLAYLNEHKDEDLFKIVLIHEPDSFKTFQNYNIDLVLAGHSLNGQIRLPFIGTIRTLKGSKKYYDSYYQIKNTSLYISGGIGTKDYNYRWFNKPSINLYRLYKK